ncbi:MAG TPA: class I SAM-dependent methyltransferase [Egibacteraceae bacterium]|nr:class I SAM-dependent methyltransferase [Actinomycetota bacterium]HWB73034.1 class I SAM-dependent methyltransferase [Egibacteraceae bacterium]
MGADSVRDFYDDLVDTYDFIYADWERSVERQAHALDRLLRGTLGPGPTKLLDCSCGIGTQTLGLLRRGHQVIASDLSVRAVQRAAVEAKLRYLAGGFLAADMRRLPFRPGSFDAIVCADNSLPHLLDADSLNAACNSMASVTRPGGVLIVTVRDYDRLLESRPRSTAPSFTQTPEGRAITFQLWDWHADGEHYDLEHFQLVGQGDGWRVTRRVTAYWALTRSAIERALLGGGWGSPTWHEPAETGFFQPVVTARRAMAGRA